MTPDFDPMLAKIVVHGATREEAIYRAIAALEDLALLGVQTNIDYLARVLAHPAFRVGDLHTGFVKQHASTLARLGSDADHAGRVADRRGARLPGVPRHRLRRAGTLATIGRWRN